MVTSLLVFEFRQAVRLQVHRHGMDKTQGYARTLGEKAIEQLVSNIKTGGVVVQSVDWADVHAWAERLSDHHTMTGGHRSMDVLHVATALHLGAKEFLTFDTNQKILAKTEGLKVPV